MKASLVVLCMTIACCWAHLCFTQFNDLAVPAAGQCSLLVDEQAVLLGGIDSSGASSSIFEISTIYPTQWTPSALPMPIAASGGFCTRSDSTVYVTTQAGQSLTTASDNSLYYGDFAQDVPQWISIGSGPTPRTRAGIAAMDRPQTVFLFGGLQNGTYRSTVEMYNFSTQSWSVIAKMPRDPRYLSSCNCRTTGHGQQIFLVCVECNATDLATFHLLRFDTVTFTFLPATMWYPGPLTQSVTTISMEHFCVMAAAFTNSDNPSLYYYDFYLNQVNYVGTKYFTVPRYSFGLFPMTYNLYFAGGVKINTSQLTSAVDFVPVLPAYFSEVDRKNHTYSIGDWITVFTQVCYPGVTIRLADSPTCSSTTAGTIDTPCTPGQGGSGTATLHVTVPDPTAYVCMSYGVCETNVSARPPCVTDNTTDDFESCMLSGCCWDSAVPQCFGYSKGSRGQTKYFVQAVRDTIHVVAPAPPTTTSFLSSTTGVLVLSASVLIVVVAGAGIIWRVFVSPRTIDDMDENTEGSSHPLDQHGKFKILCKLGQGGFGTVYLVSRRSDNERFAMKYIICKDEEERSYALKEFELLYASQGHPNMIKLIEMFMNWSTDETTLSVEKSLQWQSPSSSRSSGPQSNTTPLLTLAQKYVCIVMEYCPEGDLCRYVLRTRASGVDVPEAFILEVIAAKCCQLLHHLHTLSPPIVHRDIKPENILLAGNGTDIVLTDFGLAQQVEKSYMTTRAGSLHYVAPECWKRHYGTEVDMWALGCVMYGACTGRVTAETARVMFSDSREKNFENDIKHDLRRYSDKMRRVILGLLQPNPVKRLTGRQVLEIISAGKDIPIMTITPATDAGFKHESSSLPRSSPLSSSAK